MVAFNNTFTANVSPQYMNCVIAAEQFISSHWTNPITITLTFDAMAWGPAAGTGGANPVYVNVSYTALRTALAAHANNPDAQAAVATLPATDPTVSYAGNHLWSLPQAYARMLGLSSQGGADGLITLNTTYTWSFGYGWSYGQDVIDAIEEWITEAMGRDGGLGDTLRPPGFDTYWSTLDLFRWSPAHLRDFTDGRDGQTTYFSVDGNTLLLPFFNLYSFGTFLGYPRDLILVHDFDAPDVFGHVQPSNAFVFSPTDYKVMNALGWTPVTFTAGPLMVSASGDFDGNGIPDLIWRGTNHIGMWSYNGSTVSTTDLGAFDFNWAVLGSGFFTFGTTTKQMLMDYVPSGLMTIWWVNNGQLTGINLGQKWVNVGYVATGAFVSTANRGGGGITDFLVSNLTDHHHYDWWIGSDSTLQGIDLGPVWSNVSVVATGQFKFNPNNLQHLLVSNTLDHHLYDWWIDSNNTLQGIDLGPVWSNVNFVSIGPTRNSQDSFLVANTVDHHLYDWWIGSNNALTGIDLGPVWSNVQPVATGRFSGNALLEILVQNTVDHHLYDWWITSQNQLTGIDLGPYWNNVQLVGHAHYNNYSAVEELLVRNTTDGHFYEWWIAGSQLTGVDLGLVGDVGGATAAAANGDTGSVAGSGPAAVATAPAAVMGGGGSSPAAMTSPAEPTTPAVPTTASPAINTSLPSPSSDSTSLLVQAMASFDSSAAVADSTGAVLTGGLAYLSETVAPIDQRASHS